MSHPEVLFTSFQRWRDIDPDTYVPLSIARWQPAGLTYPRVELLAPRHDDGRPLRLRDFPDDPLGGYKAAWEHLWAQRANATRRWLALYAGRRVALLCWCPHSRVSQGQMATFGTFACHSLLIYRAFMALGVPCELDYERREFGVPEWKR